MRVFSKFPQSGERKWLAYESRTFVRAINSMNTNSWNYNILFMWTGTGWAINDRRIIELLLIHNLLPIYSSTIEMKWWKSTTTFSTEQFSNLCSTLGSVSIKELSPNTFAFLSTLVWIFDDDADSMLGCRFVQCASTLAPQSVTNSSQHYAFNFPEISVNGN